MDFRDSADARRNGGVNMDATRDSTEALRERERGA